MEKRCDNERGIALISVLVMLIVMLIVISGSLLFTSISTRATANTRNATVALHIADAGISHAIRELSNNDGVKDFANIYAASNGTQVVSNNNFNGGSYVVTQQGTASSPSRVKIRAVATGPNGTSAQVEAWVESSWVCGVCSEGDVTMTGGGIVDSYDSSRGVYNVSLGGGVYNKGSNGNVASNGSISLSGAPTVIYGNASAVGTISGPVTGTSTAGAAAASYSAVSPCGPPYSSGTGIVGGSYNSSTGVLSTGSHGVVVFATGSYCLSSISLGSHSSMSIVGVTTINLTGDTDLSAGDVINSGRPSNLTINSSSTAGMKIQSGTDASMILNCPRCTVTVTSGGDFFGSIIAGALVSHGGARIHYDTSLSGPSTIKLYSWVQTF